MKRITIGLMLIALATFGASAQQKSRGEHGKHKARHHRQDMPKNINLSNDQKKQMQVARDNYRSQLAELNKNENITVKELRDRKVSLAKEHKAASEKILTSEQKNKIQEAKQKSIEKRQLSQAKRMEKMKKDLALSENQSSKLKTINESYKTKFQTIRENETLDRTAKIEQSKALKLQQKEELKNILTKEQRQKFDERKRERGDRKQAK